MNKQILPAPVSGRGFTLIEVLVAVLVLGIGLLGAAALQMLSLQNISNAEFRTQATLYSQELTELARTVNDPGVFATSSGSAGNCAGFSGEYEKWCNELGEALPGATFRVTWDGTVDELTTTITWPERIMFLEATGSVAAGEGTSDYTMVARIPQ